MASKTDRRYRPTESKYKGGAQEMYVTQAIDHFNSRREAGKRITAFA
ncbi:MAG TPA: hypothetical protein VFO91_02365 [Anaerolineales bacterium]|nr:hypothetical protein [Anaerolineales bacterium]